MYGLGLLDEDFEGRRRARGPLNIELFAGSLDDNNAHLFWQERSTPCSPTSTTAP